MVRTAAALQIPAANAGHMRVSVCTGVKRVMDSIAESVSGTNVTLEVRRLAMIDGLTAVPGTEAHVGVRGGAHCKVS